VVFLAIIIHLKSGSEKVSDGNFHARFGFAIPVHAQHQLAQMEMGWAS
jgi:hypothetical protein